MIETLAKLIRRLQAQGVDLVMHQETDIATTCITPKNGKYLEVGVYHVDFFDPEVCQQLGNYFKDLIPTHLDLEKVMLQEGMPRQGDYGFVNAYQGDSFLHFHVNGYNRISVRYSNNIQTRIPGPLMMFNPGSDYEKDMVIEKLLEHVTN